MFPQDVPQQQIPVPSPAPTPLASAAHSHIHDDDHVLGRRGPLDIPAQEKPQLGPALLGLWWGGLLIQQDSMVGPGPGPDRVLGTEDTTFNETVLARGMSDLAPNT